MGSAPRSGDRPLLQVVLGSGVACLDADHRGGVHLGDASDPRGQCPWNAQSPAGPGGGDGPGPGGPGGPSAGVFVGDGEMEISSSSWGKFQKWLVYFMDNTIVRNG